MPGQHSTSRAGERGPARPGTPSLLRELNDRAALELLLDGRSLTRSQLSELTGVGVTPARAACVRDIARAIHEKQLCLEPGPEPATVIEHLQAIRGIGEWTAHYIAMRALRWPDAYPHGDLGLRKALGANSARQVRDAAEVWRPWRAYAAVHLWNHLGQQQRKDKHHE